MNEKTTTKIDLVRALTTNTGQLLSGLLELHGIPDADQPAHMERAQVLSTGLIKVCQHFTRGESADVSRLLATVALSMASDAALHSLISKEESAALSAENISRAMGEGAKH